MSNLNKGWEDYLYWQLTDKKMLRKINELLKDIQRNGYTGIGKPEPLKYRKAWSRRIGGYCVNKYRPSVKYLKREIC